MTNEERSIEHLNDPIRWQRWPICPVKKFEGNELIVGCVVDRPGPEKVVVEVNMFSLPLSKEEYNACKKHVYTSVEELVTVGGWEVD